MALLSKEAIFAADDRPTEDVEVPEWGGTVRIRTLSGRERDAYNASLVKKTKSGGRDLNLENSAAKLVALCAIDENGNRLFPTEGDVIKLGNKSAAALTRIEAACQKLNGFTDEEVEEETEGFEKTPDEL